MGELDPVGGWRLRGRHRTGQDLRDDGGLHVLFPRGDDPRRRGALRSHRQRRQVLEPAHDPSQRERQAQDPGPRGRPVAHGGTRDGGRAHRPRARVQGYARPSRQVFGGVGGGAQGEGSRRAVGARRQGDLQGRDGGREGAGGARRVPHGLKEGGDGAL